MQRTAGNNRLTGELSRVGYRSETSLSHDVTMPRDSSSEAERRTSARLGTSVVFAGGHVALSRPVTDAFAIIVPHPSLKGQTVGINPRGERSYIAEADMFGPAVVPDLSSYQVRRVLVDVPDLPIGAELGKDVFDVVPTVRSGTLINVGTAASVLIEFVILDEAGEPISLQAGEISKIGDEAFTPLLVFSNRAGVMTSDGVVPGQYELVLFAFPDAPVQFEVAEDAAGIISLGTFRFSSTGAVQEDGTTVAPQPEETPAAPDADELAPVREAEAGEEPPATEDADEETQVARSDPADETPEAPAPPEPEETASLAPTEEPAPTTGKLPRERADAPRNVGVYRIQLAAFRSPQDAETAWPVIRDRYPDLLSRLRAVVVEVDLGRRGVFYRLQAGSLPDLPAARQLCVTLRAVGQSCLIVAPAGAPPVEQPPASGRDRADAPDANDDDTARTAAVPAVPVAPVAASPAPPPAAENVERIATPIAETPSPALLGASVQLASLRTASAAREEARRLQTRFADLLGTLGITIVPVVLGPDRGIFHRIQAGPLPDDASARQLCAALRSRGQGCLKVAAAAPSPRDRAAVPTPSDTAPPPALRDEDRVPAPVRTTQPPLDTPDTIVISSSGVSRAVPESEPARATTFRLQLAALSSRGGAEAELRRLRDLLGSTLAKLPSDVVAVDVDGAARYRIEAGRFATRAAALQGCRAFQSAGQPCLVVEAPAIRQARRTTGGPLSLLRTPQ